MTMTTTNTNTLEVQPQPQAPKQSYFKKEHNDNDNDNDNHNHNDNDKYQYNSYNPCASNKDIYNLRYEDLRKKGMKMELEEKNTNTPDSQELSIFIQRGMIEWVEVCEAWNKYQLQLNEMNGSKKIKVLVYNDNDNDNDRQLDTDTYTYTDTASDYTGINLPLNLQAQVKNLIVQIVMSTLPNKMSPRPITQR
jgi:hypothetical protein